MSEKRLTPRLARGPAEVLRAITSADLSVTLEDALEFQRESFHAALGCYPEELVEVCPACGGNGTAELPYAAGCSSEWHLGGDRCEWR